MPFFRRFLFLIPLLFAIPLSAQPEKTISYSFDGQPLIECIRQLEKDYGLFFTFDQDLLENLSITAKGENEPIPSALEKLFANTGLTFEQVGQLQIIVKKSIDGHQILTLCGTIKGADSDTPLPYATVGIKGKYQGTTTNPEGKFEWTDIFEDGDQIIISFLGYQDKIVLLETFQEDPCAVITLAIQEFTFDQVVLAEYLTTGIEQSDQLSHISMEPDRIKVVPGLTESDVLQMAQLLPGITSPDESAAGLHIRGGTPDQNLILLDGIPVYNSGHFFGMISAFNPYIVDKVDIYRSGFGPEYGGRISGVIDIQNKNTVPDKVHGGVGFNLTHGYLDLEIPIVKNKVALLLSGRRSFTDFWETPTFNRLSQRVFQASRIEEQQNAQEEEDLDVNLDFFYDDLNAKLIVQPNSKDKVTVSFYGSENSLKFLSDNQETTLFINDDLFLSNIGAEGSWQRTWNERYQTHNQLVFSRYRNQYRNSLQIDGVEGDAEARNQSNGIEDITFRHGHKLDLGLGHSLLWGYQFSHFKVDYNVQENNAFEESWSEQEQQVSKLHTGYLTYQWQRKDRFYLDAGLRYNFYSFLTSSNNSVEPRISMRVKATDWLQLKLGAGWYRQYVNQVVEFNDLGINDQLWVLSDGDFFPYIKSSQVSGGFLLSKKGFQLDVESYYKFIEGLTSIGLSFRNTPAASVFSQGNGEIFGLDVLLKKRFKKYNTWVSYSFSKVRYKFDDLNNELAFPAPHDQPHNLTWVHQLFFGPVSLSIAWHLATGRPYTTPVGVTQNPDEPDIFFLEYGSANDSRLPNYHRLDLSAFYTFPSDPTKNWTGRVGLSLLNLYNRENVLSRSFFVDEDDELGTIGTFGLDRFMLGVTPNLMVRFEF